MFQCKISSVQNTSEDSYNAFFACTVAHRLSRADPENCFFFEDKYKCSDAFDMPSGELVRLMSEIEIYARTLEGSYLWLKDMDLRVDMWSPAILSLNTLVGTGSKNLYEMASGDNIQYLGVKGIDFSDRAQVIPSNAPEVVRIGLSVTLQEVFLFRLQLDSFQYFPNKPEDAPDPDDCALQVSCPRANKGEVETEVTSTSDNFYWDQVATFGYKGTKAGFMVEFLEVGVFRVVLFLHYNKILVQISMGIEN